MKLVVGQQRSISELIERADRGRVAKDQPGKDAAAYHAAQLRQVDLADRVLFAAVGIFGPRPVGVTDQSPDLQLEVCRVQLSCMAPISDILARSPFQLGTGTGVRR